MKKECLFICISMVVMLIIINLIWRCCDPFSGWPAVFASYKTLFPYVATGAFVVLVCLALPLNLDDWCPEEVFALKVATMLFTAIGLTLSTLFFASLFFYAMAVLRWISSFNVVLMIEMLLLTGLILKLLLTEKTKPK